MAFIFLAPLSPTTAQATDLPLWLDIAARNTQQPQSNHTTPHRTLKLDENQLLARIQSAEETQSALSLTAPLPDGSNAAIELQPVATLSPELQQRYPDIKTWRIHSKHPRIRSGRAELTALGFRIMLRSADSGEQWLIEPTSQPLTQSQPLFESTQQAGPIQERQSRFQSTPPYYQSYHKRQAGQNTVAFSCGVQAGTAMTELQRDSLPHQHRKNSKNRLSRTGNNMLSYDLAISATGEYTQRFDGSKTAAYGAIVSTVNRINEIYTQELGITLKLVSGEETVFSNPATDPFDNASLLLAAAQNQEVLDVLIGSNRYDIGHVIGAALSNNGLAYVSSICNNSRKAQGITLSNAPLADYFMVDYVAHEIGHQLGATHTFNSGQNGCGGGGRIANTAFEPGSGSTIMSYAGLCARHDLQQYVDPQFHSGSVDQIYKVLFDGQGASCAQNLTINNSPPSVNAGPDYTIPARTPFILSGTASDIDNDNLLYSWDQMDTGDTSAPDTDTANNALIKSNPLSNNGMRYVPDLSRLLDKSQSPVNGESLPRSMRDLNFRLTARDGKGANGSDDIKLSVYDTGADFRILSPTGSLASGSHEIRWQVANTHQPPISCATVDIAYTNDQGITFTDIELRTPNDGSATVQLSTPAQHIRIKCSTNIFFALSGLTPHIASYKNDTAQPTHTSPTTTPTPTPTTAPENNTDDGGGGTMPIYWLFFGILMALTRLRRLNPKFHQATLTVIKNSIYSQHG